MLKLTTDKHEASRGLSATADLLVYFQCMHAGQAGQHFNLRPNFEL